MSEANFPDALYAECSRLLSAAPAGGERTRSLFAQEALVTIIIWEVIVEGIWRLGARSLAEGLWAKLSNTVQRLRQTRLQLEDQPRGPSSSDVEAVIHQSREDLASLGHSLAPLKDGPGFEQVKDAKNAIQKVLVDAGWSEAHAGNRAQEIVALLANRMGLEGGVA